MVAGDDVPQWRRGNAVSIVDTDGAPIANAAVVDGQYNPDELENEVTHCLWVCPTLFPTQSLPPQPGRKDL